MLYRRHRDLHQSSTQPQPAAMQELHQSSTQAQPAAMQELHAEETQIVNPGAPKRDLVPGVQAIEEAAPASARAARAGRPTAPSSKPWPAQNHHRGSTALSALTATDARQQQQASEETMGKTITVTFDNDVPEAELEAIRGKIRKILRGEAVPEPEVVGQWDPSTGNGNIGTSPGTGLRD